MRIKKNLTLSSAILLSLSNSLVADDSTVDVLDTISITATRAEEKTLAIPASVGVIDKQKIALDKPNYQKELFNSISGVRVTQTGSTLGHKTSIRMPLNTGSYYLFLQDGIPVQSSGFFNHNGLAYTNFTSASSAEVLKGAGTALYGSDAVAATVNVISNDPSLDPGVKLSSNVGSDGFIKLGLSAGKTYDNGSSLGAEISTSTSDGWRDHTQSERTEMSLTHLVEIDDNNIIKTIITSNSSNAEMSGSLIGLDELQDNPTSMGDIQNAVDSGLDIRRKFDFTRLSTEWTHFLNDEVELSTIAYIRNNRNQYIATWQKNLPKNDSKEKTVGVMFKADIEGDKEHWMLGTDLEITQSSRSYQQLFDYVPTSYGSSVPAGEIYNYDVDYIALSPYVRYERDLSNKMLLTAGLRYDTNSFDYTNNLADGEYASSGYSRPDSSVDPSFNHLSPKLSLSYKIDDEQNTYVRYANGFRIPQASRLYSLSTNNIDFDLNPEVTDTIEVGYKVAKRTYQIETALYYMTIDDSIVRRTNSNGDRYYVNGGKTTHKGVEITLTNRINKQFSTKVSYSYSKHNYVDDLVYGNNEQAAAPNHLANLSLTYKPKSITGLTMQFEIEHIGEYWLDDQNTRTYDGYDVAHLKVNYKVSKQLKLSAKINNLTDEIYAEDATYSYGKEKYTPGAPRQLFAGLEYSF